MRTLPLLVLLAACGGDDSLSPREGCERYSEVVCERIYACFTPQEIMAIGFPPTEAGCVTRLETDAGCANATEDNVCAAGEAYHPDKAGTCFDKASATECSQVRDPNYDAEEDIPECAAVCE